ncbi:hypothetical protein SAMN02745127_02063 [Oceanospirillum multiglobuliferum]|uniref:Chitin-binding type-3 domain-containing protein n=1 Tax=Oceanospirillum multiglobuliferum TaxID=64969 RepID=A0A1T4QXX6_9GAMM|nr:hypothetical protein [Oceanospirillum multiglobuliferum]OPX57075.1 hypothetical protein BTE48_01195 [Oceanospirillum multiglobuliferum]SKA08397.1 hypothetical protein SAMN02745127_02063 [Oceanospirillum multiglobuliferum]
MDVIRPAGLLSYQSNIPLEYPEWDDDQPVSAGAFVTHEDAVWEVLTAHTTDTPPSQTDTRWQRIGPTNRFAMLDEEVNTKTIAPSGVIELSITAGRIDAVALLGLRATSIEVRLVVDEVEEFSASANLVNRQSSGTWLGFFTEPLYQQDFYIVQGMVDTAVIDLPKYLNAVLHITIINTGGPAECGVCRPGLLLNIGDTENDAETGIEDYSLREIDQWGRLSQQARNYAKEISTEVYIDTDRLDFIYAWLVKLKDTPLVWLGIQHHSAYIVYGYGKWRISRSGTVLSKMSIEVEGLV